MPLISYREKSKKKRIPIPGKDMHITLDMELQEYIMEKQFETDGRAGLS